MMSNLFSGKIRIRLIDLFGRTIIRRVLGELRKQQYMSTGELETIRKEKLNRLFKLAHSSTRYYKDFQHYHELPPLDKETVSRRFGDFISAGYKRKFISKTTGGSTGIPFKYYTTNESQSYMWAGVLLSWEAAGYQLGESVAFLAGSSLIKSGWKHNFFYRLLNIERLPASPLDDARINEYAERMQKNKTTILYGYCYAINTMAEYLNRQPGHRFPHLKGVVCTAERLTDSARKKIEKAFGVPVYDQYGCNEGGVSAFECQHKNKHLISTRAMYETDEDGTLISTDLSNEGFIMMKYNTTDIVEFSDEPCACKRNFPVIKKMVGRLNDVVVDMDHKVLHASFFGIAFSKDTSIHQYQITFNAHSLTINIHSAEHDESYYRNRYISLISEYARFDDYFVVLNAPFEKTPNGKHREVVDKRKVKEHIYTE